MKKSLLILVASIIIFFACTPSLHASSSYVLPYPSVMPGGIQYKLHVIWEKILQYWYFGNFGQYIYNLNESDKYLVEAKTLFEYQQYLLGYSALIKSDQYFKKTLPFLLAAQKEGKDIASYRQELHEAALKHTEVLTTMQGNVPSTVTWQPEKSAPTLLNLKETIQQAITIRQQYE